MNSGNSKINNNDTARTAQSKQNRSALQATSEAATTTATTTITTTNQRQSFNTSEDDVVTG